MKKSSPLSSKSLLLAGAIALAALAPASGVHAQEENNIANVSIDAEGIYITPGNIANFTSMSVSIMNPRGKLLLKTSSTGAAVDFVCGCDQDGMYRYAVSVVHEVEDTDGSSKSAIDQKTDIFSVLNGKIVLQDNLSFQKPQPLKGKWSDTILLGAATILDWIIPPAHAEDFSDLSLTSSSPIFKITKTGAAADSSWWLRADLNASQNTPFFAIQSVFSQGVMLRLSALDSAKNGIFVKDDGHVTFSRDAVHIFNYGALNNPSKLTGRIGINQPNPDTQLHILSDADANPPAISFEDALATGNQKTAVMKYADNLLSINQQMRATFNGTANTLVTRRMVLTANNGSNASSSRSDVAFSLINEKENFEWMYRTHQDSRGFMMTKIGTGGAEMIIQNPTTNYENVTIQMGSGAKLNSAGEWENASSRDYKENIENLSTDEAMAALKTINPVKYHIKRDPNKEPHLGFIAEDVPDLVASKGRRNMSPMKVIAMLTKVVQEQQQVITELKMETAEIKKEIRLQNMVSSTAHFE